MDSENSSKYQDTRRGKYESLLKAFNDINWDGQKNITSEDILYFLDLNSQKGKFDPILSEKLLLFLGLDNSNSITVEDFINSYMKFDSNLQSSKEEFSNKLLTIQNSINNLEEQCNKYKNEHLDAQGLCANAKLTVEICDIDIKIDVGDLNLAKIIIEILYNNNTQEKSFDVNQEDNENINKTFEFKPRSKTDNFVIALKCLTDANEIFEIGSKEFPVNQITTQDEYSAQIEIPENNDINSVGAVINAKILLYWSDYQYFVDKKNEMESKMEKLKKSISETNKYCKEINDIYSKNMNIQPQPNRQNIEWSNQIKGSDNDQRKASFIDIDNNEMNQKLNNDNYNNIGLKNNAFDINTNDEAYRMNINPKYFAFIKMLGIGLLCLGFADGFYRNEFPNQLLGILIFLSCYDIFKGNYERTKLLNKFNFYFCIGLLFLDIIWIFSHFNEDVDKSGGPGGFAKGYTKFIVALSVIAKGFSSVILFKKK